MSAIILGCLIFVVESSYFICWFGLDMKMEPELELFLNAYSWKIQLVYTFAANSSLNEKYASTQISWCQTFW